MKLWSKVITSLAWMNGGLPRWLSGLRTCLQCRRSQSSGFHSWVRKIPWKRAQQPTTGFLPGLLLFVVSSYIRALSKFSWEGAGKRTGPWIHVGRWEEASAEKAGWGECWGLGINRGAPSPVDERELNSEFRGAGGHQLHAQSRWRRVWNWAPENG